MNEIDYIEFKTTHQDGSVTYSQATQALLDAPATAVKIEQLTHYENGGLLIAPREFLIRPNFTCPIDPQERLNCAECQ